MSCFDGMVSTPREPTIPAAVDFYIYPFHGSQGMEEATSTDQLSRPLGMVG